MNYLGMGIISPQSSKVPLAMTFIPGYRQVPIKPPPARALAREEEPPEPECVVEFVSSLEPD